LTHEPPRVEPKQEENLTFTLVADGLESAVAQATVAAGERVVQVVVGVDVTHQLLEVAREVDWSKKPTLAATVAIGSSSRRRRRVVVIPPIGDSDERRDEQGEDALPSP